MEEEEEIVGRKRERERQREKLSGAARMGLCDDETQHPIFYFIRDFYLLISLDVLNLFETICVTIEFCTLIQHNLFFIMTLSLFSPHES